MRLAQQPIGKRERRPLNLRAAVERADGSTGEVLVLDLSSEGCGIETVIALEAGERIKLTVPDRGAVLATVRWCEDGKAGLVFEAEDPAPEAQQPRSDERAPYRGEVLLRRLGGTGYSVHVLDISPEGCKVELVETPRIGEHLLIKFDGLEALDVEVCWVEGPIGGLKFEKSFHPAVYEQLLKRLR
jgi:hypothetical protein